MAESTQASLGSVVSLWRYPVKSMMGEELNAADVSEFGLLGDRAYAIIDRSDGKVATAKNPRKWPHLFDFRAALIDGLVRITLPDGSIVRGDDPAIDEILSKVIGRDVTFSAADHARRDSDTSEEFWLDLKEFEHQNTVTEFHLPEGTFFDAAVVHVLTTLTLDRLRSAYPQGRFEARRFRPNIVVQAASDAADFPENGWIGRTISVGDEVQLNVTAPCSRCVMTTLAQGDLPNDPGILRTAAQNNAANVGVYASVIRAGRVRRGDAVALREDADAQQPLQSLA